MPVIGRLDEQVDEVLIRPASRRGRVNQTDEPSATRVGEKLTRTTTPEDSKTPTHASDKDDTSEGVGVGAREELPVWLL